MTIKVVTAPVLEPLTTAEAKTHLRVDVSTEDAYIAALVTSAREHVENVTNRALLTQTLELVLDDWPGATVELPRPPLQSVTSISYTDIDGVTRTVDSGDYLVDADAFVGRIVLKTAKSWPSVSLREVAAIRIRYVAGWTAANLVPPNITHAVRLLVGHMYENREQTMTGVNIVQIPMGVDALLMSSRVWWF